MRPIVVNRRDYVGGNCCSCRCEGIDVYSNGLAIWKHALGMVGESVHEENCHGTPLMDYADSETLGLGTIERKHFGALPSVVFVTSEYTTP